MSAAVKELLYQLERIRYYQENNLDEEWVLKLLKKLGHSGDLNK